MLYKNGEFHAEKRNISTFVSGLYIGIDGIFYVQL